MTRGTSQLPVSRTLKRWYITCSYYSFAMRPFSQRSEWHVSRERGRSLFRQGDYVGALRSFQETLENGRLSRSSLSNSMSIQDEQYTLSNIIACRLSIGGFEHATMAVDEAKECIALNPRWSKAHVRLASAYLYLGVCEGNNSSHRNRYSNDACNSLQTALQHDPNNQTARQMLVQELRHRDAPERPNGAHSRDPPMNPSYRPPASSTATSVTASSSANAYPVHLEEEDEAASHGVDGSQDAFNSNWVSVVVSRIQCVLQQLQLWYISLTNDQRNFLHLGLVLLLLYIGFGGRFGLESTPRRRKMMGNYGHDNVYEQYRREKEKSMYGGGYNRNHAQKQYYEDNRRTKESSSYHSSPNSYSSFHMSEMSGLVYIGIAMIAVYVGRLYGLSPWQVLMMLRIFQGGGGGVYHYGGGWGRRRRW
jgi:tetratricopeptide (TPR) repeat protein